MARAVSSDARDARSTLRADTAAYTMHGDVEAASGAHSICSICVSSGHAESLRAHAEQRVRMDIAASTTP
jgi:hypothetical protein